MQFGIALLLGADAGIVLGLSMLSSGGCRISDKRQASVPRRVGQSYIVYNAKTICKADRKDELERGVTPSQWLGAAKATRLGPRGAKGLAFPGAETLSKIGVKTMGFWMSM